MRGIAGALAAALLLAGCAAAPSAAPSGGPSGGASTDPSASRPASPSAPAPSSPTVPVADPSHAVPPPGPRTGPLTSADLLVFSQSTIPASIVDRIRSTKGVHSLAAISLAQTSVEDKLLNVVAADPATYRLFEPAEAADDEAIWDRVAGGELAVSGTLQKKVPTSKADFVKLGSQASAPSVHVGAYVEPIPGLPDLVVNPSWGQALGMAPDNALLISTGSTSPDRVVRPIQRIVGAKVSVQRLDVVARTGIDPGALQTAYVVGSVADAVGRYVYRYVGGGRVAPDPAWVAAHITTETVPILGAVTCNRMLFPQLRAALQEVADRGLASTIHTYSGCYNPRFIAGTHTLSNHAFGLAIDIDAATNARGTRGTMNPAVVQIFEKWGFTWGGTWHYTDPMHFEMNRIVNPG